MKIFISSLAVILAVLQAQAQTQAPEALNPLTIRDSPSIESTTFSNAEMMEAPLSGVLIGNQKMTEQNLSRLSDITKLDASVTDSYNASGYWDYLSIRGFTLENRSSYLRDGLPISALTSIPLENKERVEVLKGLSGMQIGSSSPGGLVNYIVERPSMNKKIKISSEITDGGNFLLSGNHQGRFQFALENLRPHIENSDGTRYLFAFAENWQITANSILEFEIEHSRRIQKSQSGMSLLGNTLPSVQNSNLNLNNQPWAQPMDTSALTGSLRFSQSLTESLRWQLSAGQQSLHNDDRLSYPFGCDKEGRYDRYCSDGSFDVYDFRSENEHRDTQSAKFATFYEFTAGRFLHKLSAGTVVSKTTERFDRQAYNYVGPGNVFTPVLLPADPALTDENTQRDASTAEIFFTDTLEFKSLTAWLSLRHSDIYRHSIRTDASRETSYREAALVPFAALSYKIEDYSIYMSSGEGVETYITPNRSKYSNPGKFLPIAKSTQYEIGLKKEGPLLLQGAIFEIHRPLLADLAPEYILDGTAVHRGVELQIEKQFSNGFIHVSAMLIEARQKEAFLVPSLNSKRPVNVPEQTLRALGNYDYSARTKFFARFSYEGERPVTPDNDVLLSSWNIFDAGASYQINTALGKSIVRLWIENILDTKYWKESPTQYGHIYLYAGAERTFSLSLQHEY